MGGGLSGDGTQPRNKKRRSKQNHDGNNMENINTAPKIQTPAVQPGNGCADGGGSARTRTQHAQACYRCCDSPHRNGGVQAQVHSLNAQVCACALNPPATRPARKHTPVANNAGEVRRSSARVTQKHAATTRRPRGGQLPTSRPGAKVHQCDEQPTTRHIKELKKTCTVHATHATTSNGTGHNKPHAWKYAHGKEGLWPASCWRKGKSGMQPTALAVGLCGAE